MEVLGLGPTPGLKPRGHTGGGHHGDARGDTKGTRVGDAPGAREGDASGHAMATPPDGAKGADIDPDQRASATLGGCAKSRHRRSKSAGSGGPSTLAKR